MNINLKRPLLAGGLALLILVTFVVLSKRQGRLPHDTAPVTQALNKESGTRAVAVQPPSAEQKTSAPKIPSTGVSQSGGAIRAHLHNVLFHLTEETSVLISDLSGEIRATAGHEMPIVDDASSFEMVVAAGTVSVSPQTMANLMNNWVLRAPDQPLRDIAVTIEGDRLHVKGKLQSKGNLPFHAVCRVTANQDGRLRIHIERISALKIPLSGLMNLLEIDLAEMVNTNRISGMDINDGDVLIDVSQFLPHPHARAHISDAHLLHHVMSVTFDGPAPAMNLPAQRGNYILVRGGRLQVGTLVISNADLLALDLDPSDPLDWNHPHCMEQIRAGYENIRPSFELVGHVKDYGKLSHRRPSPNQSQP
jgi:hypothetical protein